MAGYVIFDIEVRDPAGYEEYRRLGAPTVADWGGRFLVRGGEAAALEGGWQPHRIVVLEFDDAARARAWYESPAYAAARAIRARTARSRGVLAEGLAADRLGACAGPAGFVVVDADIHDPERFAGYRKAAMPLLGEHGAQAVVRDDHAQGLEGGWQPRRLVLLRFPDLERATHWHASPEYQAARALRTDAARVASIAVRGT